MFSVRRAIADGLFSGPRIVAAGRAVCMTGGHGSFVGREADGPDDVRKAVREQLKAGRRFIKLIATGGVMTPGVEPGSPQLTLEEMRAAVEEARKAGRLTAAHAQGSTGIADAVEAGITTIEHGIFLTDEIIASMKRKGVFLGPDAGGARRHLRGRARRRHPRVHGAEVRFRGRHITSRASSAPPRRGCASRRRRLWHAVQFSRQPPARAQSHGQVRHDTAQGDPLGDLGGGQALGLGGETGRVAEGYAADLLAVAGNPASASARWPTCDWCLLGALSSKLP